MLGAQSSWFQYQKGAIKTSGLTSVEIANLMFQYQKGAIKTVSDSDGNSSEEEFQYQKGAIKTAHNPHARAQAARTVSIPKRCD